VRLDVTGNANRTARWLEEHDLPIHPRRPWCAGDSACRLAELSGREVVLGS
jgi:hypothetical protein